jgi:hypothetical protein
MGARLHAHRAMVVSWLTALCLVTVVPPVQAQIHLCPWPATKSEPLLTSSNGVVEWGSMADLGAPGSWNFTAYVVNLDAGGARNIDWDAAGMRVESLRPQHYANVCSQGVQGRVDRPGPLYFARDQSSIATVVYAGNMPPTDKQLVAGRPLILTTQFVVYARATKTQPVSVRVTTQLERTATDYRITYTVENLSDNDVIVDLPIDKDVASKMGDGKLPLKKGEKRQAEIRTPMFPTMIRFPVRVSEGAKGGTSSVIHVPTARGPIPRG